MRASRRRSPGPPRSGHRGRSSRRSPRRAAGRGSRAGRRSRTISPVERRQVARRLSQEVVLPAPFGPTMPIRSPRCAARNGTGATTRAWWRAIRRRRRHPGRAGSRRPGPPAGRDLAAARRAGPTSEPAGRDRQLPTGSWGIAALVLEPFEPGLVLVHLAELAVAPVPLDQSFSRAIASACVSTSLTVRASRSTRCRW